MISVILHQLISDDFVLVTRVIAKVTDHYLFALSDATCMRPHNKVVRSVLFWLSSIAEFCGLREVTSIKVNEHI